MIGTLPATLDVITVGEPMVLFIAQRPVARVVQHPGDSDGLPTRAQPAVAIAPSR